MTGRQSDRMAAQTESGSDAREQPVSRRTPGLQSLSGWGNWPITGSEVVAPTSARELLDIVPLPTGQIARGLGRSYGDAAQLAGGTVIDMTGLRGIQLDTEKGIATAKAGTSLGQILDFAVPHGWFLPVSPGTSHVTVGGAIAADVHGKNHHRDGSFGQHVESFELITSDHRAVSARPGTEAFTATVGGMGLTGMISRAAFRLIPIETEAMTIDTRRDPDFLAVMQSLFDSDARHRYSVAWLDLSRHGRGRGVVMGADHASVNDVPRRRSGHTPLERTVSIPARCPRLVNELTVAAFNQMWYSRAPRRKRTSVESINSFFYPLDKISNWNRLYGRKGFLQYQFVVPYGEENTLVGVAEDLVATSTPISLAVLKRMGESDGGLISFPIPGWTLALDMPLGDPDLAAVLDGCDAKVARAGGRVYLAKDSRLRHEMVDQMYPNLSRWKEARERLDPDRRLRSNLSNRLGLTN